MTQASSAAAAPASPAGLAGAPWREQSRARYPDEEGYVERDGVRLFLVDTERGIELPRHEAFSELCARVRCPTLVLHGDRDLIRPHAQGQALADATGGTLVTLVGSGHCPQARDPVRVNLILREFMGAVLDAIR